MGVNAGAFFESYFVGYPRRKKKWAGASMVLVLLEFYVFGVFAVLDLSQNIFFFFGDMGLKPNKEVLQSTLDTDKEIHLRHGNL
jgi:hypothetical protein